MDGQLEEAHYFHTLTDFYEVMEAYDARQVVHDLEKMSPLLYQMLESAMLERNDKRKKAALFEYNKALDVDIV